MTTKRMELFNPKGHLAVALRAMIKLCGIGVIQLGFGLGGQKCPHHGPRRVLGTHRRLLSRLHYRTT